MRADIIFDRLFGGLNDNENPNIVIPITGNIDEDGFLELATRETLPENPAEELLSTVRGLPGNTEIRNPVTGNPISVFEFYGNTIVIS